MARFINQNSLGAGWQFDFLDNEGVNTDPGYLGVLYHANTAKRTYTFPDKDGTLATTADALVNPMTTLGDLIVGGSSGVPARLAKGTDGQVLAMVAGAVSWQTQNAVGTSTANGTTNLDGNQKGTIQVSVTGDATINMINGGADGQRLTLELKQDASGNHTITLGTGFAWGADITSYTPTLTALMTDYIGLVYNATASVWRIIAIAKGY